MLSILISLALLLSGCSPRGTILIDPAAAEIGAVQQILVATTREPAQSSAVLSSARSTELSYFDFGVAVPPERLPGSVTFPERLPPDPRTDFLTVSAGQLADKAAFASIVDARLERLPADQREVLVFVHGFNTTFAEGLYRQAQMSRDFGGQGVSVNYAWPSAADIFGYASDRESVLFARDGLEDLLTSLARTRAKRIILLGHSMGAHLVMESLRQMDIRDTSQLFSKLSSVVLFAPDLDLDVLRMQVVAIEDEDIPVFVFVSGRDRALRISSRIRRASERLGSVGDISRLSDLPVTVIDISRVTPGNDPMQHSKAATSPTMIALIDGMGAAGLEMFRQDDRRPTILESGQRAVQGVSDTTIGPSSR